MMGSLLGSANDRAIKKYRARLGAIGALEDKMKALKDDDLPRAILELKERRAKGASLNDLLPESFALTREAARRSLGQRHYDVQLIGGMVLNDGKIAEMKTGEGKTLVATLPVVLNAIEGKGAHVITVNEYLAKRDCAWMSAVYKTLGLSAAAIVPGLDDAERRAAYACDITYATNSEIGFDYLRDNLRMTLEEMTQRDFFYAIVDEVDSILIDEARTPLIISGSHEDSAAMYTQIDPLVKLLKPADYEVDEKNRNVFLTDQGSVSMEEILVTAKVLQDGGLYDTNNIHLLHHVQQALRAHKLYQRDVQYIVRDDAVMLVDEFTGRIMEGRRLSEGLHQAIEAKEHVNIRAENQTIASITYQNFFRLYPRIAGMTGTAITESAEFHDIYKLETLEIPTHKTMVRKDHNDEVYRTAAARDRALIAEVKRAHDKKQPVLIGTQSIEKSEALSKLLKAASIPHSVLNARHHAKEAQIIAQAGCLGSVTIATNMAGRGTDIQLGGNFDEIETLGLGGDKPMPAKKTQHEDAQKAVLEAGGLYVIGTGRHESRRIDNQLRGRSGRQGDAGESRFYLSLDDELLRVFGAERMDGILSKMGLKEDESMAHPLLSRTIEQAQQKVERMNYDVRKQLLRFDDVMNDQRKVIFSQRRELMAVKDVNDSIVDMRREVITQMVEECIPPKAMPQEWESEALEKSVREYFDMELPINDWANEEGTTEQTIIKRTNEALDDKMAQREAQYQPEMVRNAYKHLTLIMLDQQWKDHLQQLERLRRGIGLRAYGQRDPFNEFKREAFGMFESMLTSFKLRLTSLLARVRFTPPQEGGATKSPPSPAKAAISQTPAQGGQTQALGRKTPRNAPCHCGSGRKFKHCHGKVS